MPKAARLSPIARFFSVLRAPRGFTLTHAFEREVLFVAIFGFVAFYLTALASFNPLDVSWLSISFPSHAARNLAGAIGANLSGLALFIFGVSAWLLPAPLLTSAVLVIRKSDHALAKSRLLGWTLGVCCLAAFASVKAPVFSIKGFDLPSGGLVGAQISHFLRLWLGDVGSIITLSTTSLCSFIMILRKGVVVEAYNFAKKTLSFEPKAPLWWDKILHPPKPEDITISATVTGQDPPIANVARYEPANSLLGLSAKDVIEIDDEVVESKEPVISVTAYPLKSAEVPPRPKIIDDYVPPPVSIFQRSGAEQSVNVNPKELESTAALLVKTFEDFGVQGKIIGYQPGPVVTVYEFQPDAGVKQSKVLGLIDDLALALKVDSIFIHPVRGKRALGVQVPNSKRETVHFGDIVSTSIFKDSESPLTFGMGKSINGQPMCADLAAMPHLLVAGATGSGKSVGINSFLCSIIMKSKPEDVRMILVDPKMLELSVYEGIPHLLMPVITEPTRASLALRWAANEMERRYKLMQHACVRNIAGFNAFWEKSTDTRRDEFRRDSGDVHATKLPYIVLVIDELADLMMTAPKDVESSIQRLAQKARASGIHMVLATQRPSVDIITGVIKANLPCRIAFQVVSKHDSRTILDLISAEKLLGKGDMLLQRPGVGRLERIQGAFITDEEVLNLVAAVKASSRVEYDDKIISWIDEEAERQKDTGKDSGEPLLAMDDDPKYDEAINIARTHGVVSASFLQRHLKIGYNRAARIVEFMESQSLVDKADGAKPRKWLGPMG